MGSSNSGNSGDRSVIELAGKIVVFAIVLLVFVVISVIFLRLYAKWFFRSANNTATTSRSRRRRRHQEITTVSALPPDLDPSVLKTIPVVIFNPKESKDGLECAVCLSEVSRGEKARFLPKCSHGFHVKCIDKWFQSHSTCPLCRNPVAGQDKSNRASEIPLEDVLEAPIDEDSGVHVSREAPSLPDDVLLRGDEAQVRTLSPCVEEDHQGSGIREPSGSSSSSSKASAGNRPDGMLMIDIPRQEEQKSPLPTRLGALTRPLSGNRGG